MNCKCDCSRGMLISSILSLLDCLGKEDDFTKEELERLNCEVLESMHAGLEETLS